MESQRIDFTQLHLLQRHLEQTSYILWLENVLLPLVRKYPEKRHEIALGAQMRINVTRDYYDGLAAHFLQEQP
jgi:hypothetical protein